MISSCLKFECRNNVVEYEALMLGLKKAISLNVVALKVILHHKNNVDALKDTTTNEDEHEKPLKAAVDGNKGNPISKGVASLNKLYDLQNLCQGPRNNRTHMSTTMNEQRNLGTNHDSKIVSLGTNCTTQQRQFFDRLIKQYPGVSVWADDDLSTHHMRIIQHRIPGKGGAKPLQQLGKTNMSFELLIKKKLTKWLDAWITYKVCHHT